jgi:hypothetical protein
MNPPESEATIAWRLNVAERRIEKLDEEKADAKDMARLSDEVKSLRTAIYWFMGIVAIFATALIVVAVQFALGLS